MRNFMYAAAAAVTIVALQATSAMATTHGYTAPTKSTLFTDVTSEFTGVAELAAAIAVAVIVGVALVALAKKGPKFVKWGIAKLT